MPALAILDLLRRCWWAPIILALAIALLATRATLAVEKRDRSLVEAKLAISNASLTTLQGKLDEVLADQLALSTGDASRIKASREVAALADAASQVRQSWIDNLRASAASASPAPAVIPAECTVSPAVLEAWP